jgi:hypothetical protein
MKQQKIRLTVLLEYAPDNSSSEITLNQTPKDAVEHALEQIATKKDGKISIVRTEVV